MHNLSEFSLTKFIILLVKMTKSTKISARTIFAKKLLIFLQGHHQIPLFCKLI